MGKENKTDHIYYDLGVSSARVSPCRYRYIKPERRAGVLNWMQFGSTLQACLHTLRSFSFINRSRRDKHPHNLESEAQSSGMPGEKRPVAEPSGSTSSQLSGVQELFDVKGLVAVVTGGGTGTNRFSFCMTRGQLRNENNRHWPYGLHNS